jgi:hypothetical protein
MATKKKDSYGEEVEAANLEPELCGHVNRHSMGVDGLPDNMTCFRPKGHDGLHRGKHLVRFTVHQKDGKRIIGEVVRQELVQESEWSDGAGIPFEDTPPVVEIKPKSLAEQEFGEFAKTVLGG